MDKKLRLKKTLELLDIFISELKARNYNNYINNFRSLSNLFFTNRDLDTLFKEILPSNQLGNISSWLWNHGQSSHYSLGDSHMQEITDSLIRIKSMLSTAKNTNYTVFYSWQSDLPSGINRRLIENSLKNAIENLNADLGINIKFDKDTLNIPGSPDIINTILQKINNSDIFVCDVSVISNVTIGNKNKNVTNPNVMFELGYAFNALGEEKIIMVHNEAFGQNLPFDLGLKRLLKYSCTKGRKNISCAQDILTKKLYTAIKTIYESE